MAGNLVRGFRDRHDVRTILRPFWRRPDAYPSWLQHLPADQLGRFVSQILRHKPQHRRPRDLRSAAQALYRIDQTKGLILDDPYL